MRNGPFPDKLDHSRVPKLPEEQYHEDRHEHAVHNLPADVLLHLDGLSAQQWGVRQDWTGILVDCWKACARLETGDYLMAGHCLISPLSRPFLTPGQGRNWFCLWCSNGLHTNVRKVSINVLWSALSCCRESSATTALSAGLACQSGKSCLHYEQLVLWLSHNQSLSTGKIVRIMT